MRRTPRFDALRPRSLRRCSGFTLIEAVMVIALTGGLAAVVAQFIVPPVRAYLAVKARGELVDNADLALRRIGRDLRGALPNSVRVSADGQTLELIPTTAAARYATEGSGALSFGEVDTSFGIVGPPLQMNAAQQLVFYNLGPGVDGADAYATNDSALTQAGANRRLATNAAGAASTVTISSLAGLPVGNFAPPYRVYAVDSPVSYRCDLGSGRLVRHQGYGFQASQPLPPSGGSSAVLATGVSACQFSHDGTVVAARAALVSLRLALSTLTSAGSETVTLHHAVHVSNLP
ncbi:PulJ/GspJ family protein [Rubrivivax rivuli]|uniref:Type II secretion system protein n=1 Tax=Rubrivivax rivuli TaxID=1862385 RepID=A0A437RCD9_9BURK|nr:type II secretion system protein [Rubrivivax rivuli]RVU44432.1 type II secretion system protein [Rubrivivax rivuli]